MESPPPRSQVPPQGWACTQDWPVNTYATNVATVINWGTTQVNLTSLNSGTFVAILRHKNYSIFSSVQSLSRVRLFVTPWITAHQASLSITNSQSSLRLTSIKSVMPFSNLILGHPLLLLPLIPPSIRVFSNESTPHMKWPKYWSFSFSIIPSKEIPGLISFRMDWLDLLAVQGTLKSLLQQHSSKTSILWCSAFFTVQLSHLYMTTGKTIALTRQTNLFFLFRPSTGWINHTCFGEGNLLYTVYGFNINLIPKHPYRHT